MCLRCLLFRSWMAEIPKRAGSRRRYLLKWGVESYTLVPERILAIGETFAPEKFKTLKVEPVKKPKGFNWPVYREVLVKWMHLPYTQATWETIETEFEDLDPQAIKTRIKKTGQEVLDPCGRRLLPRLLRRHLLRLTTAYCSRIATILCDAYGNHTSPTRKLIHTKDWKVGIMFLSHRCLLIFFSILYNFAKFNQV